MIQKRFISYSLIIHLLAMSLLFVSPVTKEQKGKPFFARLVTPEDVGLGRGEITAPKSITLPKAVISPAVKSQGAKSSKNSKSSSAKADGSAFSVPSVSSTRIPQSTKGQGESVIEREGQETETSNTSQFNIPPGTGLQFPGKREDIEMNAQKSKGFSPLQSAREAGEKIAKKTEGKQEKSSITFDVKGFKYDGYMLRLKDKIEGIWQYPSDAAMRGIYGDLYLSFTIKKNGNLSKVELVRTSGYKSLDDAAIKALKDAAPYWPLPEDWKEEELTVKGHFMYSIYGVYVR